MQPAELDKYLGQVFRTIGNALPEIELFVVITLLLLLSLFKISTRATFIVVLTGIVLNLALTALMATLPDSIRAGTDDFFSDPYNSYFKVLMSIAALLTVIMGGRTQRMEYFLLIMSLLLGSELLIMSANFIVLVISIEIVSISSYVLVAGTVPDKRRAEAAWKFFIFGSTATAVMIFGMTYFYGATGWTNLFMAPSSHSSTDNPTLVTVGGIMMLAGLFFKMTIAPFHFWAPDVYEATPSPVVAYLSVVPKIAGLWVVSTIVWNLNHVPSGDWHIVTAGFATLSILIGTLGALGQKDVKRMMAYSSIAHAGFLLIGVTATSFDAMAFYAAVFLAMNYAVFVVVAIKEKTTGEPTLYEDFTGLGYTALIPAVSITIAFVSLTGLPPVAGFTAKLLIFTALWSKYAESGNLIFLLLFVVGLLATVASLFFYFKIPFYLFFRQPAQRDPLKISGLTNFLLLFLVGILLVLFLFPSVLGWVGGVNY